MNFLFSLAKPQLCNAGTLQEKLGFIFNLLATNINVIEACEKQWRSSLLRIIPGFIPPSPPPAMTTWSFACHNPSVSRPLSDRGQGNPATRRSQAGGKQHKIKHGWFHYFQFVLSLFPICTQYVFALTTNHVDPLIEQYLVRLWEIV